MDNYKMKYKSLIYSILFIFVLISVCYNVHADTYVVGQSINIKGACTFNGAPCDNAGICNISIIDPNENLVIQNAPMTNLGGGIFNYSLIASQISIIGYYNTQQVCCDQSQCMSQAGQFQLTPTGNTSNVNFYWIILIVGVLAITLGFWKNDPWMVTLGGFCLISIGIYFYIYGVDIYKNQLTDVIALIVLASGLYFSVRSTLEVVLENYGL